MVNGSASGAREPCARARCRRSSSSARSASSPCAGRRRRMTSRCVVNAVAAQSRPHGARRAAPRCRSGFPPRLHALCSRSADRMATSRLTMATDAPPLAASTGRIADRDPQQRLAQALLLLACAALVLFLLGAARVDPRQERPGQGRRVRRPRAVPRVLAVAGAASSRRGNTLWVAMRRHARSPCRSRSRSPTR